MLRLAQRHIIIWPLNYTRTTTYFTPFRPNTLIIPRKSFNPNQILHSRRLVSGDAKPSAELLKQGPSSPSISSERDFKLPVTQRLKILFKKYRWPALAIYFGLSVVDFGIAFIGVRAFGTENIGRYEKIILKKVEDTTGWKTKGTPPQHIENPSASIWTEIALAYTIHKTLFALIRIPVTVAITPAVVKWFTRKGYGAVLAQRPVVRRLVESSSAFGARK